MFQDLDAKDICWFSFLYYVMVITVMAKFAIGLFRYEKAKTWWWKLDMADILQPPSNPSLLCVMVGDGVQILGMSIVTILLAALGGFMSPASRKTLIIGMLFSYMIFGIAAGYVAVRLWRTILCDCGNPKGWVSISWKVACFFPGISFFILFILDSLLWSTHSTKAIPFSLFVILILLWFSISIPFTLLGGYYGTKAPHIEYAVQINQNPCGIPAQKSPYWLWVLPLGCMLLFSFWMGRTIIMSSMSMINVYYVFGLLFVMIFLVVACVDVSLALILANILVDDNKWWWKSLSWLSTSWLSSLLLSGMLVYPFWWMGRTIIMSSISTGSDYYVFGLFFVMFLLVVACADVSLFQTYFNLCVMEDYKWWWKSFFASGSSALIVFLYCIIYLNSLSGHVSATLYLGYSLIMVIAIMLATGTVGFLSSFWFVRDLSFPAKEA